MENKRAVRLRCVDDDGERWDVSPLIAIHVDSGRPGVPALRGEFGHRLLLGAWIAFVQLTSFTK